MGFNSGFKGLK